MTKNTTKRALLFSVLALVLCMSMFVGTTFAWFTDSVTSGNNKIVAGTLKIDLELLDKDTKVWNSVKENSDPIFTYENWEPGYTDVKILKIQNEGTLALKWKATFVSAKELGILADVIDVYVKEGVTEYPTDRNEIDSWTKVGTVRDFVNNIETATVGTLDEKAEETLGIALKMQETAGNEYQGERLGAFDITILATQLTSESDSFDDQYDANAEYDGINVPEDAIEVADLAGFTEALAAGGNYEITAPFTVEGILNVSADTILYNTNSANVITFAQNARLKTAENADLALYGVKINGGGSYTLTEDAFKRDQAKNINTDAILMASAGSTLTLGEGTVIENVVSQYPAVAWAKGTVDNRATIIFEGATVRNCAGGSGTIINVDRYGDVYIEEGTVIENNISSSGNHGIIRIYNDNWDAANASTLTINGGEIRDNYFSGNGMIGLYYAKMYMNGGKISNNSWLRATATGNGFYCVTYVHSNSQFIMNGGEISGNTITDGAINAINSEVEGAITFNGGTVTNNSNTRNENKDALAAVCYPYSMQKTLVISENANVTGTVYNHAIEGNVVVRNYSEISEYFGE